MYADSNPTVPAAARRARELAKDLDAFAEVLDGTSQAEAKRRITLPIGLVATIHHTIDEAAKTLKELRGVHDDLRAGTRSDDERVKRGKHEWV